MKQTCHYFSSIRQGCPSAFQQSLQDASHVSRGFVRFVDYQGVTESGSPDQGRVFVNNDPVADSGLHSEALHGCVSVIIELMTNKNGGNTKDFLDRRKLRTM